MKITIELSEAQVKGLKTYLKEVSGDINPKITKEDIANEIKGIVYGTFQQEHNALADYIKQFEN